MGGVSEISIRRGGPSDAAAVFAIHRESALAAYAQVFPPDRYAFPDDEMRRHWELALVDPDTEVVIAEREGTPVAFASVSPGWLRNLFVVPAEWGCGPGAVIHDEAVRLLAELGVGARLWVLEANERARRFYARRGWRPDGERGRSEFPPYPPTLRYELDLARGLELAVGRTHPKPPPSQRG
jgi:GNAT superfamily N-acetyltransferase